MKTPISKDLKLKEDGKISEEDFEKLKHSEYDLEKEQEELKQDLITVYHNITDLLKKYCDLDEESYTIIAIWIIGTYFHDQFESYPYLFLNAMRGSGKSRTLRLITDLSKDGEQQASMTEAVLFRTKGTLGIDEFEGIGRKGNENLRELLNAAYKKGTKIKRMRQKKTVDGVKQVVESFDVYRPIVMANITGMEEVLGDRCISILIDKSNNEKIINLVEIWKHEEIFKKTKKLLEKCSLCSVVVVRECYLNWNKYILYNNTTYNYTNKGKMGGENYTKNYINNTLNYTKLFEKIKSIDIDGRNLELTFPLLLISYQISVDIFNDLLNSTLNYIKQKKEDQFAESKDISLIDYVSQETTNEWISTKEITQRFKEFLQSDEEWITPKWVGWGLRRLKLRKKHKREAGGIKIILDIKKAQEKIRMFK